MLLLVTAVTNAVVVVSFSGYLYSEVAERLLFSENRNKMYPHLLFNLERDTKLDILDRSWMSI